MKQPNEVFDKEAFVARLMAIGTKPKPRPKPPTAQEKAAQAFKPTLEAVVKANANPTNGRSNVHARSLRRPNVSAIAQNT